jgi:hypothetical protein
MYNEQIEILADWEKYLAGKKLKQQLSVKKTSDQPIQVNGISLIAIDDKDNIILKKPAGYEMTCNDLFPVVLCERQMAIDSKYKEDINYDDFTIKYNLKKEEIYQIWFKASWGKLLEEYNNIPETFFTSIHYTDFLDTKGKFKYFNIEIIKQ